MDNWYTSIPLAQERLDRNTACTGTIMKNRRGLPGVVVKAKLKKGQVLGLENKSGIQVVKWHDKRDMLTISTDPTHSEQLIPTGKNNRNGDPILNRNQLLI